MACIRTFVEAGGKEAVGAPLKSALPWTPNDFVRGLSQEGDRGLLVDSLCRPLPACDDLRFIYQEEAEDPVAVMAERLEWDSTFFGYGVAKLHGCFHLAAPGYRPFAHLARPIALLLERAQAAGIRYLFTQVDPRDLSLMRGLGEAGFCLIEPRVYLHRDIRGYDFARRFPVREAREEDLSPIMGVARETVNIFDRFHADPFIAKSDADRLMDEWIRASLTKRFSDLVLVPDLPGEAAAVVTARYLKQHWEKWNVKCAQIVLGASSPQMPGWGMKLLSELLHRFAQCGVEHVYLSTQATNLRVIKVCEHLDFHCGKAEFVFRKVIEPKGAAA